MLVAHAFAQQSSAPDQKPAASEAAKPAAAAKPKTWTVPRLPDGHPDLQGVWTNATLTPLQRAQQFASKATLTEAEAAAFEKTQQETTVADKRGDTPERDLGQAYNLLFYDRGSNLARVDGQIRTSLIVDPPDGHLPPRVDGSMGRGGRRGGATGGAAAAPQASEEGAPRGAAFVAGRFDSVKDRPLAERCLVGFSSTSGPPMMPAAYNSNYQIVQSQDTIMILVEMVHDVRLIRMDGSPHLPSTVTKWLGDSIGHWEGDTLVVDRVAFDERVWLDQAAHPHSDKLHIVERYRRPDLGHLETEITVDDPGVLAKPFTMKNVSDLAPTEEVLEFICTENNKDVEHLVGK
jgi:hypothetical protein